MLKTIPTKTPPSLANIYPEVMRDALMAASRMRDLCAIDQITDAMAAQGLCRPRTEDSLRLVYQARRQE